jgi:SAM-dependent methyltransferase
VSQPPDWNSTLYEAKHAFVWKAADSLLELLDAQPGERILDLGCGTGHLTAKIAAKGTDISGWIIRKRCSIRRERPSLTFGLSRAMPATFHSINRSMRSSRTRRFIG